MRGRARWDSTWRTALDHAERAGRNPTLPHGTITGYTTHRCSCPDCQAAHTADTQRRRRALNTGGTD